MNIVEIVKESGVVGAGGAGFPTHVKINAKADIVIANGAECEPLLQSDLYIMANYSQELIEGIKLVMNQSGAKVGLIALKRKHKEVVDKLANLLVSEPTLELLLLDNIYPAGDEHVLVNLAIDKVVPESGIPLQVGAIVSNVTTLVNVYKASLGFPVTERVVTVTGEVGNPALVLAPIGTSLAEIIATAGGIKSDDYAVIVGGPMMGEVVGNLNSPITKLTSALIVLSKDHKVIVQKTMDLKMQFAKARSTCCQCMYCTTMCPRYRLGHNLEPHKVMRALGGFLEENLEDFSQVYLCTECGLCGFYACVHELMPFQANRMLKEKLRSEKIDNPHTKGDIAVRDGIVPLGVPSDRLLRRLRLNQYESGKSLELLKAHPKQVAIPLQQHIGKLAQAVVKVGDWVEKGRLIGEVPLGELGSAVHASLTGRVLEVSDQIVIRGG